MGKLVIRIGDSWAWPDLDGCHDPNANFDHVLLTDNYVLCDFVGYKFEDCIQRCEMII